MVDRVGHGGVTFEIHIPLFSNGTGCHIPCAGRPPEVAQRFFKTRAILGLTFTGPHDQQDGMVAV
jgi:hypothetical protein